MSAVLVNVKKVVQLDAVERQALANEVSAQYGSLAFMYAKAVYQGSRSIEMVHSRYQQAVKDILAYVSANGYDLILE